ncbi:MAG: protein tyrosine kinase, partial [Rhodococcus sp.]|nr:protein tyrosine kinase [Rhodococcus sp. (in: high G+C Gram-positive bacteria)]
TKREQLSRAVGNLHSVGATILGAVITMTPLNGRGVYEYKYYYDSDPVVADVADVAVGSSVGGRALNEVRAPSTVN